MRQIVDTRKVRHVNLVILRWAIIPTAMLVCVTVVLWQLHGDATTRRTPNHRSTVASATQAP